MIGQFHGIDRHKRYATISVLDREGKEIKFIGKCNVFSEYIAKLNEKDAVVLEASNGAFFWAAQIEKRGATCYILNPHKFKIIKDSWNKTDKIDARNMSSALWVCIVTKRFRLPCVEKPKKEIRELRKLFSEYQLLNKQQVMYKNFIQAQLTDDGVVLSSQEKKMLFNPCMSEEILNNLKITRATRTGIKLNLKLLCVTLEEKENIKHEILCFGKYFEKEIKILISIKGVSPFMALAYLADVGDVSRFKKLRQMNAYLGVVPGVKSSGGKTYTGRINRASRKVARSVFTQSIHHIIDSNKLYQEKYEDLKIRRGAGRARIAFIRKIFGVMRRMLLTETSFYWFRKDLYYFKLKNYYRDIKKYEETKKGS